NGDKKDKKKKTRITFNKRTVDFTSAIEIAGEEGEFRDIIEYHGYTENRRQTGLALISDTVAADQDKKDKKVEQFDATRIATKLRNKAHDTLMICVPSARLALRNNEKTLELLGLITKGKPDRTFGGWVSFGTRFYDKSLGSPEIQAELAKYNVPLELLQQGKQELDEAVAAENTK
ncbi:MAG: hypothetical protein GY940_32355, partial [bacterium]|nr:hypothetical protein [bacterium]